ncbi:MAG: Rrf2 family transcriptional regulator [candidate division WOR-3 bacterium]|jgi:Rrf2 family protein
MLKLTNKVEYGIRALIRLYLNGHLTTKELSNIELIPEPFLERIMIELKNAGIVEGKRGPRGGYYLKKEPEEIKILDLIEVLEGKFNVVKCIDDESSCSFVSLCLMKGFWRKVNKQFYDFLSKTSLRDIIDEIMPPKGA